TSPILVVAARVETADAKRACRFKHRCESCGIKVRVDDDEFDVMERDSFAIQPCFYLASSLASDRQLIIRSAGKCRMKAQANRCKAGCGCKRHKLCRLDVDRRKMRDPQRRGKSPGRNRFLPGLHTGDPFFGEVPSQICAGAMDVLAQ